MKLKLPVPDDFGNYWVLGDHKTGPAIFPHKRLDRTGEIQADGKWTALINTERGFINETTGFRTLFDSPQDALKALEKVL